MRQLTPASFVQLLGQIVETAQERIHRTEALLLLMYYAKSSPDQTVRDNALGVLAECKADTSEQHVEIARMLHGV